MAFFQEAKASREPAIKAPIGVLALIGVIVAAHIARISLPEVQSEGLIETYALIPARYVAEAWAAPGRAPVSIWDASVPFVGHLFLHADFLHVGVNCLWLLVAGTPVARRLGTVRFLMLYAATGIIAGAAFVAANWGEMAAAIGASGAVSGMMGAAIRIFYGERMAAQRAAESSNVVALTPALAPALSGPVLFFTLIWAVANVVAGMIGLGTGANMQAVAWEAHLGGYFAGLFLVGLFDVRQPRRASAQV
jgi:membrane associated rhomboid family serine protease